MARKRKRTAATHQARVEAIQRGMPPMPQGTGQPAPGSTSAQGYYENLAACGGPPVAAK